MGTNFYLKQKTEYGVPQELHIAKTSCGWRTLYQAHYNINSVKDIKAAYDTGQYLLIDEYDEEYSWSEFEERVIKFSTDNPNALSHIEIPKHFTKEEVFRYYGWVDKNYLGELYFTDDEGYEFCTSEFS